MLVSPCRPQSRLVPHPATCSLNPADTTPWMHGPSWWRAFPEGRLGDRRVLLTYRHREVLGPLSPPADTPRSPHGTQEDILAAPPMRARASCACALGAVAHDAPPGLTCQTQQHHSVGGGSVPQSL